MLSNNEINLTLLKYRYYCSRIKNNEMKEVPYTSDSFIVSNETHKISRYIDSTEEVIIAIEKAKNEVEIDEFALGTHLRVLVTDAILKRSPNSKETRIIILNLFSEKIKSIKPVEISEQVEVYNMGRTIFEHYYCPHIAPVENKLKKPYNFVRAIKTQNPPPSNNIQPSPVVRRAECGDEQNKAFFYFFVFLIMLHIAKIFKFAL